MDSRQRDVKPKTKRSDTVISYLRKNGVDIFILIAAVIISFLWIIGAAYYKLEATAGRGGAIAVAISFFWLFGGQDLGAKIANHVRKKYERQKDKTKQDPKMIDLEVRVASLTVNRASSKHYNKYLMISSVTGTLAWGFGDLVAMHLMPAFLISNFELLTPLVVPLSFGLLPPAPVPSVSETELLRAQLSELESLDSARWKNLSDQMDELRRGWDSRDILIEISHTLEGIAVSLRQKTIKTEPPLPPQPQQTYSISFDFGRVDLNQAARRIVAQVARSVPDARTILCVGYPDIVGNPSANKRLSLERASSVAMDLICNDVAPDKITIKSYGSPQAGRTVGIVIQ